MKRVRTAEHAWGTRVELCRPQRRNALDPQAVAELREAFATDRSGAILLTAQGPAFCAGGDLRLLQQAAAGGDLAGMLTTNAAAFADLIEAILTCPRPVVAALNGPAVGGGASLALACDLRIAGPRARMVFAWSRHGLPPDGCVTATLPALVGPPEAEELLAEGAEVGTESDLAPLLFARIVAEDRLADEAIEAAAGAEKRADANQLLPVVRRQREVELAALAEAAADKGTTERLAVVYKIDT